MWYIKKIYDSVCDIKNDEKYRGVETINKDDIKNNLEEYIEKKIFIPT